jgi:hypothetical protein
MPGQLTDPLEHLWLMRWSGSCLADGRLPFFCPSLNAPTGVPLGYFPTMHVQTLAFLALGLFTDNDVAKFNVLWFVGFVATGLGTFLLAWWTVRAALPSWLAGLGAMLCGPMLMHAHGHLETMQMGTVPLFLIGWLRFVERPGWARLATAVGLYWLGVACAPYFAVLAVLPAVWAVGWSLATSSERRSWLQDRIGWLTGFGLIVVLGLAVLFSSQVWASLHGFPIARTRLEFDSLGAPLWSSFVPSPLHRLGQSGIFHLYESAGQKKRMIECSSYLGVVTLALLAYAAAFRVRFARRGFWWSVLILMVVLSWGSQIRIGSTRIPLPAGWIYDLFPPFHLIRVPARFNLFAAICAAVPASAALRDLLGRVGCPHRRFTLAVTLALVMIADLAMVPFESSPIPTMPPIYRELAAKSPATTIVDAPMFGSVGGQVYSSLWGYWQSIHHLKTTAGYPGVANVVFEAEIVHPSPFWTNRLVNPSELKITQNQRFGAVEGVDPRDYAWLYLTAHHFDHVVWHQGQWFDPKYDAGSAKVKALLSEAKVFEDADVTVFDRDRLRAPSKLTWLCGEGFRPAASTSASWSFGVLRSGRIVVYQPIDNQSVVIRLIEASAFLHPRIVRLVEGDRELARWTIEPGPARTIASPPLPFPRGLHELRLLSDNDERPTHHADRIDEARTPYSLRLKSVEVISSAHP